MAITLTKPQTAYRAWVMAAQGLDEETSGIYLSDVEELVDEAVKIMCEKVMKEGEWHRLQTSYSITLAANGIGILNDSDIPDSVKPCYGGEVVISGGITPLIYIDNLRDLYLPKPGQSFNFFTVRGGNSSGATIYTAKADGTVLTGSLTILACQYQTFSNLSPQFQDDLLLTLAELAKSKRRP